MIRQTPANIAMASQGPVLCCCGRTWIRCRALRRASWTLPRRVRAAATLRPAVVLPTWASRPGLPGGVVMLREAHADMACPAGQVPDGGCRGCKCDASWQWPAHCATGKRSACPPWMVHLVSPGSASSLHWLPFVLIAMHRHGSGSACEDAICLCIRSDHAVINASWVSSQPPSPAGSAAGAGGGSSSCGCGAGWGSSSFWGCRAGAGSTRAVGGSDGPSSSAISVSSVGG